MGSAYGGKWRPSPNKPMNQRFLGQPGEIKVTYNNKEEKIRQTFLYLAIKIQKYSINMTQKPQKNELLILRLFSRHLGSS